MLKLASTLAAIVLVLCGVAFAQIGRSPMILSGRGHGGGGGGGGGAVPTQISPLSIQAPDSTTSGTVIVTFVVTTSTGAPFTGTMAVTTDADGVVCSATPCTLVTPSVSAAQNYTGLAGAHSFVVTATMNSNTITRTATLTITSGGGSCTTIDCGSITPPSQASAVGYTATVINLNFDSTAWANKSNWLDCNNTVLSGHNFFFHEGFDGSPSSPTLCNEAIFQSFDSVAGQNVLTGRWLSSYPPTGCGLSGTFVAMATFNRNNPTPRDVWWGFPMNSYIEYEARVTRTYSGTTCGPDIQSIFLTSFDRTQAAPSGTEWLEPDPGELTTSGGGGSDAAFHHWGDCAECVNGGGWESYNAMPPNGNLPAGYSITGYHKYGMRVTNNGDTTQFCFYVDDIQIMEPGSTGCDNFTVSQTIRARPFFIQWAIVNGGGGDFFDFNIKNIRVWSCANHLDIYNNPSTPVCTQ